MAQTVSSAASRRSASAGAMYAQSAAMCNAARTSLADPARCAKACFDVAAIAPAGFGNVEDNTLRRPLHLISKVSVMRPHRRHHRPKLLHNLSRSHVDILLHQLRSLFCVGGHTREAGGRAPNTKQGVKRYEKVAESAIESRASDRVSDRVSDRARARARARARVRASASAGVTSEPFARAVSA